jgi:hypothetical protein
MPLETAKAMIKVSGAPLSAEARMTTNVVPYDLFKCAYSCCITMAIVIQLY